MLNGLFNIGQSALNASQAWISVTGNNLANADTEGYSRQYVDQKDAGGLKYNPGAQPLGVNAQQIMRFFDAFLERSYVRQNSTSSRWTEQDTIMASLENIFNESNRTGVSSALTNFFNAWQDLALRPDDTAVRQSLVSYAENLSDMFSKTMDGIKTIQEEMNVSIRQSVSRVNDLAKSIADLNSQITAATVDGVSNPNALLDKRDQLVRELSTLVDVETIDHGKGKFRVQLSTGQPLVDGVETYALQVDAAKAQTHLMPNSPYKGEVQYVGTDTHEYTIEIIKPGDANAQGLKELDGKGNPILDENGKEISANPSFRVSLDGGRTWLKDENGDEIHYEISRTITGYDEDGEPIYKVVGQDAEGKDIYAIDPVQVKDLQISFSSTTDFSKGDIFTIVPKEGLYWNTPTGGLENVTPQIGFDGVQNPQRVTGGKLAAYYNIRDDNCGRYMDELEAVAKTLIWEVNRIHSQGTGLAKLDFAQGQQRVANAEVALNSAQAMLPNSEKLQEGNVNFHVYDKVTGEYKGSGMLFADKNFDPSKDSLNDVVDALNNMTLKDEDGQTIMLRDKDGNILKDDDGKELAFTPFTATIQDGKLLIETDPSIQFAMGADTSGLMAALGINTFFAGSGASDIAVNSQIHNNSQLVASGQVNGQYQINVGDNITATAIGKLVDKEVTISTMWKTVKNQSVSQYYANLVTTVGADRRLSKTNTEYHGALADDLYERVSSVTGVNMDEEMSNLIKFQHSYTAAAKLITTADQMLQTLLGLKQ